MKQATLLASAAALLLSAGIATAEPATNAPAAPQGKAVREHRPDQLPPQLEQLNLTAAQKTKIQAIMQQNRPAPRGDMKQNFEQHRQQEQQLISSKTFNEQAARQLIAQEQQQRTEFELNRLRERHAIFQVLTPAQQQKWLEAKPHHGGKHAPRPDAH